MKTYKDVYKMPLTFGYAGQRSTWVYDQRNNFVFQFERRYTEDGNHDEKWMELERKMVDVINGKEHLKNLGLSFVHENGEISSVIHGEKSRVITIRGWGNLTGTGGMNLSADEAANIQDTFADFIVEQLNKRNN